MSRLILKSRSTQSSQTLRSRGFTAVEMLIVIAILVLLATMVVLALRALIEPGKVNATKATMQVLNNVIRESLTTKPAQDRFYGVDQWMITRVAANNNEKFFSTAPVQNFSGLNTPEAFIQTQKALYIFTRNPPARALFDSISTDLKVKPDGMGDSSNGTDNQMVGLNGLDPSTGYAFRTAIEGELNATMNYPFPVYTPNEIRDPSKNLWVKIPLVVDAWGHPILYVPDSFQDTNANDDKWPDARDGEPVAPTPNTGNPNAAASTRGGLIRVKSDANKTWWNVGGVGLPAGYVRATDPRQNPPEQDAVRAPDRRPFWVSAGPDGKYETHDDNIYSFID